MTDNVMSCDVERGTENSTDESFTTTQLQSPANMDIDVDIEAGDSLSSTDSLLSGVHTAHDIGRHRATLTQKLNQVQFMRQCRCDVVRHRAVM